MKALKSKDVRKEVEGHTFLVLPHTLYEYLYLPRFVVRWHFPFVEAGVVARFAAVISVVPLGVVAVC